MSAPAYSKILHDGLWHNNVGLVQILGLCPLLAVSTSAVSGLSLGLATMLVLVLTNLAISAIRNLVTPDVRIPVFVILIAATVTAVELSIHAFFHDLYQTLGIFIPLIVTNCCVLGRAEAFASKQPPLHAALDGLAMGLGFASVLTVLGALRELLGFGTLFAQAHLMLGEWAAFLETTVIEHYHGFLLAILPPGAFIGLGLMIALKNALDARRKARTAPAPAAQPAPAA